MADLSVPVDDGLLSCSDDGKGAPIVLLHGFSFDRTMWDPQIAALSSRYRVVRYDLRGFGRSTRPTGDYSHAEDLAALIAARALRSPLLIGLSLGANVILDFASRWPATARGLVLASPGLSGHRWSEERPPDAAARVAVEHGMEAARSFWLDHPIYASLRNIRSGEVLEAMLHRYDGWHWENVDPRRAARDLAPDLASILLPTLVVSGDADIADYRAIAKRIANELPLGRLERVANAGHLMNVEIPERFNAAVLSFASTLDNETDQERDGKP